MKVKEIKAWKISKLSLMEKIRIKNEGRPTPALKIIQKNTSKNRVFNRFFHLNTYDKFKWICGCEETNRLFCFPCLLFAESCSEQSWISLGFNDLAHLKNKAKKHESSPSHLNCTLELCILGKVNISQQLDTTYRLNVKQFNEEVSKNRYALSKIIDCIRFCGTFELVSKYHELGSPGVLQSLVNFSSELDVGLNVHLKSSPMFNQASSEFQCDLLDSILTVCQNYIKKEISEAKCVAIIADETTNVSSFFQLAIVFRYVKKDGELVERFWKFSTPPGLNAASVASNIDMILQKVLGNDDKLISQSYDGATVMNDVQTIIRARHKNAHFVHCYAHQLDSVIAQSASQNQNVRIFFSNLSDITAFFNDDPQRAFTLEEIVKKTAPQWTFQSITINTVFEHRDALIECMEVIESSSKQVTTINRATAIRRMLNDPKFIFWFTVFYKLMPLVDKLSNKLQKKNLSTDLLEKHLEEFENNIQAKIEKLETVTVEIIGDRPSNKRLKIDEGADSSRSLAVKEVYNVILNQIKDRFEFNAYINAIYLLDFSLFAQHDQYFPSSALNDVCKFYPFLNETILKNELSVIYGRSDFKNFGKLANLLKFFIDNDLQEIFSELVQLLHIIVTMPIMTNEAERCFSTLEKIKTFLCSVERAEMMSTLTMLSVEKKLIDSIPSFNDQVIDLFATKKGRNQKFLYKTIT